MYCCNICTLFASPSFSAVLRHIGNTHAGDPNLSIVCAVPGCPRESPYSKYESFRSHIYRKLREVLDSGLSRLNVEGGRKDPEDISEGSGDEDSIERGNSNCNTEGFEPEFRDQPPILCSSLLAEDTRKDHTVSSRWH